ncbi:MAG: phosphate regulon transcriptional regulator PhoB [Gammaproteobacteria bacterium]
MNSKILIVDDEPAIRQMLVFALSTEGYDLLEAGNVDEAQRLIQNSQPDLILLDWMLPGLSGVDLARRLKRNPEAKDIPIIMLTAKGEEVDKIKALDTGADDYITKPFSTLELLARIRAVLRRYGGIGSVDILEADALKIDLETHRVSINEKILDLSPTEFRLLHFFISHSERVYTRTQILDNVWGLNTYIEERTVDVHIRRLRKLLEEHGFDGYIQTVRSVGYRFSKK